MTYKVKGMQDLTVAAAGNTAVEIDWVKFN